MQWITKLFNKAMPIVDRAMKWVIRSIFEMLQLIGLAFMVMSLITATLIVEAILAGIVVFSAIYITRKCR